MNLLIFHKISSNFLKLLTNNLKEEKGPFSSVQAIVPRSYIFNIKSERKSYNRNEFSLKLFQFIMKNPTRKSIFRKGL